MPTSRVPRSLGELLVEGGWVTRAELERASRSQASIGGTLGTCLLETGAVGETALTRALASVHGVEPVDAFDLRDVSPEIAATVPARLAVRHCAVPFRRSARQVDLAMAEPSDIAAVDEIAFAAGCRVKVFAAPEARVRQAIQHLYGEGMPTRFAALVDWLDRQREAGRAAATRTAAEPVAAASPEAPEPDGERRPPARVPPQPPAELRPAGGPPPAPGPAPRRRASTVTLSPEERTRLFAREEETWAERLDAARDRDEVGRVLLAALGDLFDRVVLFGVRRGAATGWMAAGPGITNGGVASFELPFDRPSVLLNLYGGSAIHVGPLPPMPAHRALVDLLGGDPPRECVLLPLRIGGRLVAAVYGDRREEPLGRIDLGALRALTARAENALVRAILLKRQGPIGPSVG